ncbi:MAG: type II secretion system F family protein [Proteobacteria bacterium]|nr:type II secretion system F family protein [Pseudomonadota bacterium]
MAMFEFRAVDKTGKNKKGKIDAASVKQATSKLKSQGLHLVSISSSKQKLTTNRQIEGKKLRKSAVPSPVITNFTRQLSILVSTGIPYDKAFEILIEEAENPTFQHILSAIKARIVEGSSLASALEAQPSLFSKMYVAMVQAGEAGGTLDKVLAQQAKSREANEELVSRIQGALIYPIIMAVMGVGIVAFMITFIVPKIVPIFQQFNIALPLPTIIVIAVSEFAMDNWWQSICFFIGLAFLIRKFLKTNRGEKLRDRILLQIPVFGKTIRKLVIFRFTQTLGTLLMSGVELKKSLDIVRYVMGNRVYEDRFDQIITDITKRGMDLSQALRQTSIFPVTVTQMIRVGEESSKLEEMLGKISDIQEKEVNQALEKTIALLQPVMTLGLAVVVGFIVLAIMLPMFKMNQLI